MFNLDQGNIVTWQLLKERYTCVEWKNRKVLFGFREKVNAFNNDCPCTVIYSPPHGDKMWHNVVFNVSIPSANPKIVRSTRPLSRWYQDSTDPLSLVQWRSCYRRVEIYRTRRYSKLFPCRWQRKEVRYRYFTLILSRWVGKSDLLSVA